LVVLVTSIDQYDRPQSCLGLDTIAVSIHAIGNTIHLSVSLAVCEPIHGVGLGTIPSTVNTLWARGMLRRIRNTIRSVATGLGVTVR